MCVWIALRSPRVRVNLGSEGRVHVQQARVDHSFLVDSGEDRRTHRGEKGGAESRLGLFEGSGERKEFLSGSLRFIPLIVTPKVYYLIKRKNCNICVGNFVGFVPRSNSLNGKKKSRFTPTPSLLCNVEKITDICFISFLSSLR